MYESPIKIIEMIQNQMAIEYENDVLKCVKSYCPSVDKDELIKALQYDRNQYNKGYNDGAIEMANRLKKWVVESSNYWFSASVNAEIDEVLKEMIGE